MKQDKNLKINELKINEQIRKINGVMAQEGMLLTKETKDNIRNCLMGKSTTEIECQKVIERYKKIYG